MKYILIIFLFLAVPVQASDKEAHIGGSYIITAVLLERGYSKGEAFVVTMFIGLMKESLDRNVDVGDLGANAIGDNLYILPDGSRRFCRICNNKKGRDHYLREKIKLSKL